MNFKFISTLALCSAFLSMHLVDSKLLSSLLGKGSTGCQSQSLFKLPRLPTLSSLLCRPSYSSYTSYCASHAPSDYAYASGGFSSYPAMSVSSYPSYGSSSNLGSDISWTNGAFSSPYASSPLYTSGGGSSGGKVWRNHEIRGSRDYSSAQVASKSPIQQQTQQQINSKLSPGEFENNSNNNNFVSSLYPSYGARINSFPSKVVTATSPPPAKVTANDVVQQQLIQY